MNDLLVPVQKLINKLQNDVEEKHCDLHEALKLRDQEVEHRKALQMQLDSLKEDVYQKKAYLLTEFGLDGSTCKKVYAWLNSITQK